MKFCVEGGEVRTARKCFAKERRKEKYGNENGGDGELKRNKW
jgi:hypothetical protein